MGNVVDAGPWIGVQGVLRQHDGGGVRESCRVRLGAGYAPYPTTARWHRVQRALRCNLLFLLNYFGIARSGKAINGSACPSGTGVRATFITSASSP